LTLAPDGKPLRHERERSRKQRRRDPPPDELFPSRGREARWGPAPSVATARNMTDAKAAAVISWRASCPHVSK
jgi:hypothetical protein